MMAERLDTPSTDDDTPGPRAELVDPAATVRFMLAGNAYVTFQSRRTGNRFTYRVAANGKPVGETGPSHFVSVLTGPDNGGSYDYLGCIYRRMAYAHGRKSEIAEEAPSAVAFAWVWRTLTGGKMHDKLAVYHEGRCGVCGRRLTTPESIASGIGPTCAGRLGR
jgi:hypothetical protein